MGHSQSKRRISAEVEPRPPTPPLPRPAAFAPPTAPAPPPPIIIPPPPTIVTYTVPFTANLIRTDNAMPGKKLQARARREIEDATWGEYLVSIMRDASRPKYSTEKSEYVPIEDWEVTLDSSVVREDDPNGFSYIIYKGTLTWTSVACPLERIQEEVNWRIGDRMSHYEINHDDWFVNIEPGTVSVAPAVGYDA